MDTKIPDLKEESKRIKENKKFLSELVRNNPFISILIILVLILGLFAYMFFFHIPFTQSKFTITSLNPLASKSSDLIINDSVFSMDKEGKDWLKGKIYNFRWVLKSNTDFDAHVIVYLRPAIENSLKPPIIDLETEDKILKKEDYIEFKGIINTSDSSAGRYNLCGIIKDNNPETGYVKEVCDARQIIIT